MIDNLNKVCLFFLFVISVKGCNTENFIPAVKIISSSIVYKTEPNIREESFINNRSSYIRLGCKFEWAGTGPTDSLAPKTLITKVCFSDLCNESYSNYVYLDVWSTDWYLFDYEKSFSCRADIPEYYIWEGIWLIGTVLRQPIVVNRVFLGVYERKQQYPDVCISGYFGQTGWVCTEWGP